MKSWIRHTVGMFSVLVLLTGCNSPKFFDFTGQGSQSLDKGDPGNPGSGTVADGCDGAKILSVQHIGPGPGDGKSVMFSNLVLGFSAIGQSIRLCVPKAVALIKKRQIRLIINPVLGYGSVDCSRLSVLVNKPVELYDNRQTSNSIIVDLDIGNDAADPVFEISLNDSCSLPLTYNVSAHEFDELEPAIPR